jgi:hypothetical protein
MNMTEILSGAEIAYIEQLPARVKKLKRVFILVSLIILGFGAASLYSAMQMGRVHGIYRFSELAAIFLKFDVKPNQSYTGWEICLVNKMGGAFIWVLVWLFNWNCFYDWWRVRQFLNTLYHDPAVAAKSLKGIKEFNTMYRLKRNKIFLIIAGIFLYLACFMEYQLVMKIAALVGIKDWKELLDFYLGLHYRPDEIYGGWIIYLHQKATMALMLFGFAVFLVPLAYYKYKIDNYPYILIGKIHSALKQNLSGTGS